MYVGGLAGYSDGPISSSYATGNVFGVENVGGLVGLDDDGPISGTYATGNVFGVEDVGGLVGKNDDGQISASYAIGKVEGDTNVGGFIGRNSGPGQIIGCFWDTQTSGQKIGIGEGNSIGGEGKSTVELQGPTGYLGIFSAWVIDFDNADQDFDPTTGTDDLWDFGTSSQYPVLKADINGDGVATWQEFGNQRPQSPAPTVQPTVASTPMSTTGAVDSNARPSAEVFGELVQAGLLASVWRYHNATASWDAYDPNIPAELNDLTHAAPKDIVWVKVTETTQFQGRTLHKGWNLITLK